VSKVRKIWFSVLTALTLAMWQVFCLAATDVSGIVGTQDTKTVVQSIVNAVKTPIQIVAVGAAVILFMVRSVLLVATQDEHKQAQIKKSFGIMIIGLIGVFFAASIVGFIVNAINK
jgi:protein-S-isoprenylcysteine O-methyltransferase Ste14